MAAEVQWTFNGWIYANVVSLICWWVFRVIMKGGELTSSQREVATACGVNYELKVTLQTMCAANFLEVEEKILQYRKKNQSTLMGMWTGKLLLYCRSREVFQHEAEQCCFLKLVFLSYSSSCLQGTSGSSKMFCLSISQDCGKKSRSLS